MKEGGRIVFISSNIADFAALPTTSLYSMVKSGLDGLAKGMARDLGPRGITVNTVHPGPINTEANPEEGKYGDQLRSFINAELWHWRRCCCDRRLLGKSRGEIRDRSSIRHRQWFHGLTQRLSRLCEPRENRTVIFVGADAVQPRRYSRRSSAIRRGRVCVVTLSVISRFTTRPDILFVRIHCTAILPFFENLFASRASKKYNSN
jgi:NAD(P)-dependent dehydrogenase (short-subunit alcohol dehydrogenase family)